MHTNFPNGVTSFGVPTMGVGSLLPWGKTLFVQSVHSRASDSNKGEDKNRPLATIARAIALCAANAGDHILVGPGHSETINEAGAITFDKAGLSMFGFGHGTLKPQIIFATAQGADLNIDAANTLIDNFLFTSGRDSLTGPIDVNAADFSLLNSEWRDGTAHQAVRALLADANASRLRIMNFRYDGDASAGASEAISLAGCDGVLIDGFRIDGNFSVGCIDLKTTAVTDLEVRNGIARNRNSADIFLADTITGSTGMIGPNIFIRVADNAANITEALGGATLVYHPHIWIVNNAGEVAMATNITASTDA
ncbi:MAG: hypothetical protein AB7I42_26065 [Bradyrhizobium sp.]|uniref:hypothetical protein n=1 Tax=Bradyrhizobium sp. TaxID=376 RepID=UPI003D0B419F